MTAHQRASTVSWQRDGMTKVVGGGEGSGSRCVTEGGRANADSKSDGGAELAAAVIVVVVQNRHPPFSLPDSFSPFFFSP